MKYVVKVITRNTADVLVEASSLEEAKILVEEAFNNGEIIPSVFDMFEIEEPHIATAKEEADKTLHRVFIKTGKFDCEGNELFVGCVVWDNWNEEYGYIQYDTDEECFMLVECDICYYLDNVDLETLEIVGNIHTNAELIAF